MAINPAELERSIIYDYDDVCGKMENPARGASLVRKNIEQQLRRMFDPESFHDTNDAAVAVAEITKDVLVHGKKTEQRRVSVEPSIEGVSLSSFSVEAAEKPLAETDPDCHGFGEQILKTMYGYDYSFVRNGNDVERHLLIRGDIDLVLPRIRHNN